MSKVAGAVSPELVFFTDLARRGKHPASSSGERAARKLAEAMLAYAPLLDSRALCGAEEYLACAQGAPESARAVIE